MYGPAGSAARSGPRCEQSSTSCPRRNASIPARAQPVKSVLSTECPAERTASSFAFGYCASVRRALSSGVRRSWRPEITSTGTFGPA